MPSWLVFRHYLKKKNLIQLLELNRSLITSLPGKFARHTLMSLEKTDLWIFMEAEYIHCHYEYILHQTKRTSTVDSSVK